jgi:hypothetical protein
VSVSPRHSDRLPVSSPCLECCGYALTLPLEDGDHIAACDEGTRMLWPRGGPIVYCSALVLPLRNVPVVEADLGDTGLHSFPSYFIPGFLKSDVPGHGLRYRRRSGQGWS